MLTALFSATISRKQSGHCVCIYSRMLRYQYDIIYLFLNGHFPRYGQFVVQSQEYCTVSLCNCLVVLFCRNS